MDRHTRWIRRRILTAASRRLLIEGTVVLVLTVIALLVAGVSFAVAGPWAATSAQLWLVGRLVAAMAGNPLNHHFLDHYTTRRLDFAPVPYQPVEGDRIDEEDPDPVLLHRSVEGHGLPGVGLHPVATLQDSGAEPLTVDVYQPVNRLVVAIVSATTLLASRLDDGRILITTGWLTAPHELLFVNFVPGADRAELAARHTAALRRLHDRGIGPVRCGAELAADVLVIEREAFAGVGPFLGSFLSLEGKAKPHLVQTSIDPGDLVRLAVSPASPVQRPSADGQDQWPPANVSRNATATTGISTPSANAPMRAAAGS